MINHMPIRGLMLTLAVIQEGIRDAARATGEAMQRAGEDIQERVGGSTPTPAASPTPWPSPGPTAQPRATPR